MDFIEKFCASFKVKYMHLDKLFKGKLDTLVKNKRVVDTVNIFINFESLYKVIRREYFEKLIATANKAEIKRMYRAAIAGFINVAAHYREYFKRHKIATNFFYYYNEIPDDYVEYNNSVLVPSYRKHFVESMLSIERFAVNSMIVDMVPFMKIIVDYIEDVYMISSKRVEASLIPHIILTENKFPANMNIIISKDSYDFQYCNSNCLIISKYKSEPLILTKYNVMDYIKFRNKFKNPEDKDVVKLNPLLMTFIFAFLGNRKRGVPGIKGIGYGKIHKELEKLYSIGYISDDEPDTMNYQNLMDVLDEQGLEIFKDENFKEDVASYYKVFDFEYQTRAMSDTQKEDILDQLENKSDPSSLIELNDRYFEYSPLQLMELANYNKRSEITQYI